MLKNQIIWKITWGSGVKPDWVGASPSGLALSASKFETFVKKDKKRNSKLSILNIGGALSMKYLSTHL